MLGKRHRIASAALAFAALLLALVVRAETAANAGAPEGPRPGDGCPGRLEPYAESPELKARMSRYGMATTNGHLRPASFQSGVSLPRTEHEVDWFCGHH